jgi:hypothetical protein
MVVRNLLGEQAVQEIIEGLLHHPHFLGFRDLWTQLSSIQCKTWLKLMIV